MTNTADGNYPAVYYQNAPILYFAQITSLPREFYTLIACLFKAFVDHAKTKTVIFKQFSMHTGLTALCQA
jgi:hypothetical protein